MSRGIGRGEGNIQDRSLNSIANIAATGGAVGGGMLNRWWCRQEGMRGIRHRGHPELQQKDMSGIGKSARRCSLLSWLTSEQVAAAIAWGCDAEAAENVGWACT